MIGGLRRSGHLDGRFGTTKTVVGQKGKEGKVQETKKYLIDVKT